MASGTGEHASAIVIGAGAAGLATALLLARSGIHVVVIERDVARPPEFAEAALGGWKRSGIPQFGNGHAFHGLARQMLRERLPDVLNALLEVGVTQRRFYLGIPKNRRVAADAELVSLQCRRPVFDWAMYRAALAQPGLRVLPGHSVVDLLRDRQGIDGVVLENGTRIRSRWVVDATGHRRTLRQSRKRLGVSAPRTSTQPAPTCYYARHFRRLSRTTAPLQNLRFGLSGDLGYLRFSVLEEDSGCFVVTINSSAGEQPIRGLQSPSGWQAAAAALPGLRDLVHPGVAEPISGVHSFAGRGNILMEYEPCGATPGLLAVGDALCQTNPTQGWGISIALKGASILADSVVCSAADRVRVTQEVTAKLTNLVRPFFEAASAEDRERLRQAQFREQEGSVSDPSNALFCRNVVYQLGSRDIELFRAGQQRIHLLDDPRRLPADRELMHRAAVQFRSEVNEEPSPLWPERGELERLVGAASNCSDSAPPHEPATRGIPAMPDHLGLLRRLGACDAGRERDELLAELSEITEDLIQNSGRGLDLTERDLGGFDLSHADLRRASMSRANLHRTKLVKANLREITMVCPGMERTNLCGADMTLAYVHALAAQTCNFDGADLSGLRDATGTLFHGCSMRSASLAGSHLAGSSFYQCDLTGSVLDDANLQGSLVNECLLTDAHLRGALLDQVTFVKVGLARADLSGAVGNGLTITRPTDTDGLHLLDARLPRLRLDTVRGTGWQADRLAATDSDLTDVTLTAIGLKRADFTRSMWRSVSLSDADLSAATLTDSKMSGCTLRRAKLPQVHAENLNLVECDLAGSDFSGISARCLTARDVNLSDATLSHANLYRAMLTGDPPKAMSLARANLRNAVLVQAYVAADLHEADLTGVTAAYSRFSQSRLDGAVLDGVNMHESTWVKASFVDASLSNVKPPVFADRCAGLLDAVQKTGGETGEELLAFLKAANELLASSREGST